MKNVLKTKTYSYLTYDSSEDKNFFDKKKPKFKDYKNCLEAAQREKQISHLGKTKTDGESLKEGHKEFIKSYKLILKAQQNFRS